MNLKDLDRPAVTYHCQRWDADVVLRPLSALDYIAIAGQWDDMEAEQEDAPRMLGFYAAILAATVESHPATAEEWLALTPATLIELGTHALRVCGLLEEDAKKN